MDGRDLSAVQLGDVPQMRHTGEVASGDRHRGFFNLAGPKGDNALPPGRQREHADTVKQASQCKRAAHTQCAPKTLLAMPPVLNSIKVSKTVYPIAPQIAPMGSPSVAMP